MNQQQNYKILKGVDFGRAWQGHEVMDTYYNFVEFLEKKFGFAWFSSMDTTKHIRSQWTGLRFLQYDVTYKTLKFLAEIKVAEQKTFETAKPNGKKYLYRLSKNWRRILK